MVDVVNALYIATLIFALLTVIFALLCLNTLFKNKIKELFSDRKFFIFFFLLAGYVLFALGELTWYITQKVFERTPTAGMHDFYWITGALFMLVSFIALSRSIHQSYGQTHKFIAHLILATILIIGVILYTSIADGSMLGYVYPLLTALILIFSANLLLYYRNLDSFEMHLLYLFFANIGFLGGDLLFSYWGASNVLGALSNIFYIFAYGLSALAFLTLMLKFYQHSSERLR